MLMALLIGSALAAPLTVQVTDVRNETGQLRLLAWSSAEGFPAVRTKAAQSRSVAAAATVRITLDLPPGTWAITVLHDEDGDGELATNLLGIPKEGVGASVPGGMSRLGPPRFKDAAFTLDEAGRTVTVAMAYLL